MSSIISHKFIGRIISSIKECEGASSEMKGNHLEAFKSSISHIYILLFLFLLKKH